MGRYDYTTYAKIPDTPTSAVYRFVMKAIPYTRDNGFYANWAGNGCCGGLPVDLVDEIFRRHDVAYAEVRTLRTMQLADDAAMEALKKLDRSKLCPEALAFMDRSQSFFSKRALTLVGKPISVLWRFREAPDCPLQTKEDMRALFTLEKNVKLAPATQPEATVIAAAKKSPAPSLAASSEKRALARSKPGAPRQLAGDQSKSAPPETR